MPTPRVSQSSAVPAVGRATINDVARAAGVSKTTVSRHLNGRSDLLAPELAARVAEAIRVLGYRPSPAAQGLKHGRSRLVGLIVADIANPYSVAVLRGAERALREAGYLVMLFNVDDDVGREREAIEALAGYQVEGFLLHAPGNDPAAVDPALRRGKPVVLIDRRVDAAQVDLVALDNAGAVRTGVSHLHEAGYRRLLFVGEPAAGVSTRQDREAAFAAEVAARPGLDGAVFEAEAGDAAALDAAIDALVRSAGDVRCAVFSGNAVVTLRVAAAAARRGLALGADLGLLGFDDTDWAPLVGPGISTIAQPTDDIGRCAAACLLERMHGTTLPARQVLLPGTLVARSSTRAELRTNTDGFLKPVS